MKTFLCHWGDGYMPCDDKVVGIESFTDDIGYDGDDVDEIAALDVGAVADLSTPWAIHTVKRLT